MSPRDAISNPAIQFEDIHGTVCDDLLVLGGINPSGHGNK